jgi:lactate permease
MFQQLLTPVGDSLGLSFIVAILPIVAVLVLLGLLRRPAWQAALAGLITGLIVAVIGWKMPVGLAVDSVLNGAVFALWPVMWIVINALLLYNIAVRSGRFDAFRNWVVGNLPNDRRVILVVVGFCFGALLEGVSGFGTPVAITSSLLILVGYPPLEALVYVLIFNTAPVAFGALGAPVTVLGAVTGLPATALAAMIGRQLPVIAIILPFYVMALYGGWRSIRALWPVLLVAGGSFAISQFAASNYIDYTLTDVLSSLGSLIATLLFLQIWRPLPDKEFAISSTTVVAGDRPTSSVPNWQGWLPWVVVSATVILWTSFKLFAMGQQNIAWPGLHRAISWGRRACARYRYCWCPGIRSGLIKRKVDNQSSVYLEGWAGQPRGNYRCFRCEFTGAAGRGSSPAPRCSRSRLSPIGNPMRGLREIGKWQKAAAGGHGNYSFEVETGAKGAAFAREHYCAQALIMLETHT